MNSPATTRSRLPAQTAFIYLVGATAWIVGSDLMLHWLEVRSPGWLPFALLKGLVFVAVTTYLLYRLVTRALGRTTQAEADLRLQEQRWRLALDAIGDGVWETDMTTKKAYYSSKWKNMLGYSGDEVGMTMEEWLALIHPDDRPLVEAELKRYLAAGTPAYRCEFRIRQKDGTYRWILSRGSLLPAADGHASARMIGTHTDISARKIYEMEKQNALAFATAVLSSSPAGIIAYRADGQPVIVNESAARIIGGDVPALLRLNFRELESWRRHGLLADADRALATGVEVRHRGPLVTSFGRSLWIEARLVPFIYEGEKHLLFLVQDETETHRTVDKLRLMQAAVEAAPVGWMVTDAVGNIEWVNPGFTTLTGYAAEEAVGRNTRILKSGRQKPEFYGVMWHKISRGEVWSGEVVNQRKDGTHYNEYMTIAPVRDNDGVIGHYVAIKQDISEHRTLEQQFARTQRLESVGLLACGMAHDLNNMLTPIMLSLGLLRAEHPDPATAAQVRMMESAAQRGAGVLRQVLMFAQGAEGDRIDLEPKHLIKEVAQLAEETFPRQIRIMSRLGPGVNPVSGDLTQIHQVLLNLAVNARDAMPTGGMLTLHAENVAVDEARAARQIISAKPGNYVRLGVRDTGTGIPPEVVEHMFEPFFTTKPRGKGSGLGLSTVFGIVRSHGGFIEVETGPGKGTDICVLLPAVVRATPVAPSDHPAEIALQGRGRRVLVVEDETAIRDVTCVLLRKRGFIPVGTGDGVEALARFIADPVVYAAVVMDLMMPKMDGYQLARELHLRAPALPILAVTGLATTAGTDDSKATLQALGVRTLLHKPYSEAELFEALGQELDAPAAPEQKKG